MRTQLHSKGPHSGYAYGAFQCAHTAPQDGPTSGCGCCASPVRPHTPTRCAPASGAPPVCLHGSTWWGPTPDASAVPSHVTTSTAHMARPCSGWGVAPFHVPTRIHMARAQVQMRVWRLSACPRLRTRRGPTPGSTGAPFCPLDPSLGCSGPASRGTWSGQRVENHRNHQSPCCPLQPPDRAFSSKTERFQPILNVGALWEDGLGLEGISG